MIWRLIAIHAASVLGAGTFVALSIASVQGVLINLLTGRGFRRVSPWVQMALNALNCPLAGWVTTTWAVW